MGDTEFLWTRRVVMLKTYFRTSLQALIFLLKQHRSKQAFWFTTLDCFEAYHLNVCGVDHSFHPPVLFSCYRSPFFSPFFFFTFRHCNSIIFMYISYMSQSQELDHYIDNGWSDVSFFCLLEYLQILSITCKIIMLFKYSFSIKKKR